MHVVIVITTLKCIRMPQMSYLEPTVPLFFDEQIFDEVFRFSRNIIPDLVIEVVVDLVDEVERLVIVVTSERRVATEPVETTITIS